MRPGRLLQLADEVRYAVQRAQYDERYPAGWVPVNSPLPPPPPRKPAHMLRREAMDEHVMRSIRDVVRR